MRKSRRKSLLRVGAFSERVGAMLFRPLSGAFGDWLKCHRKDVLDINQLEFADAVGCSVNTIQSYEQNRYRPSKTTAERIAQILHYPDTPSFVIFARQKQARKGVAGYEQSSVSVREAIVEVSTYAGVFGVQHAPAQAPLAILKEAEAHYWMQCGPLLLHEFFGELVALPTTLSGWTRLAEVTQEVQHTREATQTRIRAVLTGEML